MGILLSKVFQTIFGSKEVRILILGLDNAGKTTILYRLQNEVSYREHFDASSCQKLPVCGATRQQLAGLAV